MQATEGNYSNACKLADMRVIDLKRELEKRGMKKEGVKHFLVEQLSKALQDEGNNLEEYLFAVPAERDLDDSDNNTNYKESLDKEYAEKEDIGDGEDLLEANDFVEDVSEDSLPLTVREDDILSEEEENADSLANDDIQSDDIQIDVDDDIQSDVDDDIQSDDIQIDVDDDIQKSDVDDDIQIDVDDDIQKSDVDDDIQIDVDDDLESSLCGKASFLRSQDVNVKKPTEETVKNFITDHCNEPAETSEVVFADVLNEEFDNTVKEADCKNVEANEESNDCDFQQKDTEEEKPQDEDATVNPSSGTSDISTITFKSSCPSKNTAVINAEPPGRVEKNALNPELQNTTNLWVRGIAPATNAFELKSLFSNYSKVLCAKVVRKASKFGACYRGFITVATSQEASKCISNLHRTSLNGRIILVERTLCQVRGTLKATEQPKTALPLKKLTQNLDINPTDKIPEETANKETIEATYGRQKLEINPEDKISEETTDEAIKTTDKEEDKVEQDEILQENEAEQGNETEIRKDRKDKRNEKQTYKSKSREMDRDRTEKLRNMPRERHYRSRRHSHQKGSNPFHLQSRQQRIRPNSTKQRFAKSRFYPEMKQNVEDAFCGFQNTKGKQRSWRRPERELRKNENERVQEISRQHFINRIQRDESDRLDRERKRLRIERAKLQRKRTEILRLVREREILEREHTEWKRELQGNDELRQIEETQRTMKRHFPYGLENESYQEYRKRASLSGLHHQFDEKTKPSERHHLFERQREWYNRRENSLEVVAREFDEVPCRVYAGQIPPSYDNNRVNRVPKRPERNYRSRSREAVAQTRTYDKRLW